MGVNSEKLQLHQIDGGNNNSVHSEKWVVAGIAVRSPVLKPIFTKRMEKSTDEDDEDQACSTTPTYAESRIPIRFACPPAPKKRKQTYSRSCHCNYGGVVVREFFNPPDLETIFIRRVEGA